MTKAVVLLTAIGLFSCSTSGNKAVNDSQEIQTDSSAADALMLKITGINENSPLSVSSSFTADGVNNGQKFKIEGTVTFDRKGYYKISVLDYVFRSKVLDAYRDMDRLYFYYPVDKKLIIDDINKIDIYRYTGFRSDFDLIYTLLTGGVPLLKDAGTAKCVAGDEKGSFNLVLENSEYMQNIYFKNDLPEKIMLIHKSTRDRLEIYIKSHITDDKSLFFKNIRIVAPEKKIAVNIKFSSTKLNGEVKVEKFDPAKIKKDVEIIKVH